MDGIVVGARIMVREACDYRELRGRLGKIKRVILATAKTPASVSITMDEPLPEGCCAIGKIRAYGITLRTIDVIVQ